MELVKMENQGLEKSTVNRSTRHLLNSIKTKNQVELSKNLDQFTQRGIVKYDRLLSIPFKDRLPGLVEQYGKRKIHGLLVVLLTAFQNGFNLIRPMTAEQVVECANELIETSYEDHLSIEDFTLFFSGAKAAKYGRILDRMDQQTIFELFEVYRQERHREYLHIKEEKEANYKILGAGVRTSEDIKDLKELFHQANLQYFKTHQVPKVKVAAEEK